MERKRTCFFAMDLCRAFKSKNLYIAIIGVIAVLFFSIEDITNITDSVLYVFVMAVHRAGSVILFIFCAYPYASCFSEDLEENYIRYALIRGNLKRYVTSKVSVIMITSISVLIVGCVIFALICGWWLPWSDNNIIGFIMSSGSFRYFWEQEWGLVWFALYGLQKGILAGILALIAAYSSLYITNKMLVIVAPALIYQIIWELWGWGGPLESLEKFNLAVVFSAETNIFRSDSLSFLWAVAIGIILSVILGLLIYRKVERRI